MLLHHKFIEIAKKHGKRLAIVDRTTDRKVTYSKALIASLILAKKFQFYDSGFIGIMVPTSAGACLSVLGALMCNRVPVMINYSTGAEKNARFAQQKCNFHTIITSRKLLEKIQCPQIDGMVFLEDLMEGVTKWDKIRAAVLSMLPAKLIQNLTGAAREDDTSVILFTSGSEKEPKAVQLSHANIHSNIVGFTEALDLQEGGRELVNLPLFHVFGLTTSLWTPIYHAMTMVTYANPLEFKTISNIVREEQITMMVGTPAFFWGYLLKSEKGDYASVRLAVCGADKCPARLREAFEKKHGVTLLEGYGATETSPVVSTNTHTANKPGSVGRPIPNVDVKIQDYETGDECQPGDIGKILVKGPCIMKGYFDDLEETSIRIQRGWYDTGDMGYLDPDGFLWHAGRLKRFVKIGGEMVSLVAVEEALNSVLPDSCECCVVELPDVTKGAKIVAALSEEVDWTTVKSDLAAYLPPIAIPKHYIILPELPKMGSGKIDFRTTTNLVRDNLHGSSATMLKSLPHHQD
jgi:acyl-[acyl-carrier-protein]-phospholipid O-acyltransferase/long-chain-fatty-acid--[acyl-carrier-protein] ligase